MAVLPHVEIKPFISMKDFSRTPTTSRASRYQMQVAAPSAHVARQGADDRLLGFVF
jgi:hypothetical protein